MDDQINAEKRPVERWAEQKGLWPQFAPGRTLALPAGATPGTMGTIAVSLANVTGPRANPDYWKFAAARAMRAWPEGWEVTEAEFDDAIAAATGVVGR